ncbi:MAG: hypothetical protein ACYTA5_25950 [Planctomycetota bacterium]|jgi:hypothetical protein
MMKAAKQKLTLDRPATYQIKVPGHLDESWSDWFEGMTFTHQSDGTTTLYGLVIDQAALHGILNCNKCCRKPTINVERGRLASGTFCVAQIYIYLITREIFFAILKG